MHASKWDDTEVTVSQFVAGALDGSGYESGQIETTERTATNTREALGRFFQLMVEKGALTESDVHFICNGYR